MPISKLGQRRQVVIPKQIWDALGLQTGDYVEVQRVNRTVVIKPKKLVDAEDVLTSEQRAVIDAGITEGLRDIKQGRVSPAFSSARELTRYLHRQTRKLKTQQ
ncbi:MAG: AbrB/MazE/SpoVT family DNA-binding domain-containing protein [Patescibacteria group bacterium]